MRSMTVVGRLPARNSAIAATISVASRPLRRGTGTPESRVAGWQPLHDDAPGGASAAKAVVTARTMAAPSRLTLRMITSPGRPAGPRYSLSLRTSQIVIAQRQRADALAGRGENRIAEGWRDHRHR